MGEDKWARLNEQRQMGMANGHMCKGKWARANEQMDKLANGKMVKWANGQMGKWAHGQGQMGK